MKVEDLQVYKKLFQITLEVHELSLKFPKFELYELGSQIRRSSNSAPANLAEGFGNKHTNIFTEAISRAQGEIRETIHHATLACAKNYLSQDSHNHIISRCEECSKMLY